MLPMERERWLCESPYERKLYVSVCVNGYTGLEVLEISASSSREGRRRVKRNE